MIERDLSVIIPARNEMFLNNTIDDVIEKKRGNTEIIVILDGGWPTIPVRQHADVTVIYHDQSVGQRAAINEAARLSNAKFIMKLDAHCIVDEGFDVKLMADCEPKWMVVPRMYNLHAFNWVCDVCGKKEYQGPTPIACFDSKCDSKDFHREMVWKPRLSRESKYYRFDENLHFQYWGEYGFRPEARGDIVDTMSILGACFFMHRDFFWEIDGCDEEHGSWGQQGTEMACKVWSIGGAVKVNKKTWFSHLFRTQGGDFGFPYPLSSKDVEKARARSRELWMKNKWPKAIHDLNWLLDKFKPVPGWHDKAEINTKPKKGIVYYTDNNPKQELLEKVRQQITKGIKEKHVVSVSLKHPIKFGKNIFMDLERGYLTMAKQILAGLEASDADVIFFCEHDVLYHPSHFDFVPPQKDKYYYNSNVWRVRASDGHALYCDDLQQLSGLVAWKDTLIEHYKKRVDKLEYAYNQSETDEFDFNKYVREMGFEPGTHNREQRIDDLKSENYKSKFPNLDIRHDSNLTPSRWSKDQFRNDKYTKGWTESRAWEIEGWDEKFVMQFIEDWENYMK